MDMNCTGCGKVLQDGDWRSKSGLCRACAETKYDGRHPKRKFTLIIISSAVLSMLFLSILINAWTRRGEEVADPLEPFMFAGYSQKAEAGVFVAVSKSKFDLDSDEKEDISKALIAKYSEEYPEMKSVTVMIGLPETDKPYCCFAYEDEEVLDLDPSLGLLILGAVSTD